MATTITTTTDRPSRTWKPPEFEAPLLVSARDLRSLGEARGRSWWTHGRIDGELCERPERLSDRDVVPNRVVVQVDEKGGERSYRVFDVVAVGTFATSAAKYGPPPPAPLKFVDALAPLYAPRPRPKLGMPPIGSALGIMDARVKPIEHAPRTRIFGPHAVVRDLERRGHIVTLSTDKQSLVLQSRGRPLASDLALLRAAEPLVLGFLRGDPAPDCNSGEHPPKVDKSAVTCGPTGNLVCIWHLEQRGG